MRTDHDGAKTSRLNWATVTGLQFLYPLARTLTGWGLWALVLGFTPGIAVWLLSRSKPTFTMKNAGTHTIDISVPFAQQVGALTWGLTTLLCLIVGYVWFATKQRKRTGAWPNGKAFGALNLKLLPLGLLPLVSGLFLDRIEVDFELLTLTLISGITAGIGVWLYLEAGRWRGLGAARMRVLERRRVPELLLGALLATYIVGVSTLAIFEHWRFDTNTFDLAIYDNTFWNTAQGDLLRCTFTRAKTHISAHFDPIIILLTPIYMLKPRAETLLVLQSVWLASGGIPLFLHARRTLGDAWLALLIVLMYCAAPALHGINLYDFHTVALMVPLAMWLVYAIDTGQAKIYAPVLALMLLAREDMPLVACTIGAYAILMKRPRWGVATIVAAVTYLIAIKYITHLVLGGVEKNRYDSHYSELIPDKSVGFLGLVVSSLSDPVAALAVLLKPDKLLYFGKVFIPVLGLPLFAGRKLVLYVYGLAFVGLATQRYLFSVHFQYATFLVPFLYMGVPDGLRRVTRSRIVRRLALDRNHLRRVLAISATLATLGVSAKFAALLPNDSFRGGWNVLGRGFSEKSARRYNEFLKFKALIPERASVCSADTLSPHLSNRRNAYRVPACGRAHYILMETKPSRQRERDALKNYLGKLNYEVVKKTKRLILLRRPAKDKS